MQGRDIKITLPANAGVLVLSSAEQVNRGMDSFLDGIGETFFVAVKNALEHGVVKERSLRDSLTGLFNRRVLEEMLGMEMGRREPVPLALIVLDLDNFKKVNDTFGHPAGDEVLSATGAILRKGCRPNDIVARHGGEEFAVLLSGVSCEVALKVAERLRTKIAEHKFTFADTQTGITASIGVAFIANGGITADEFLSRADQALYHAKQNGKNRVSVFGLGVFKPAEQKIVRLCEGKRVGRSALIAA
jgi:diguanylate cyclase (GGDEF)-like protein